MANYAGRDFILKLGTWSGGTVVAECTAHTLTIAHETVDITNKSSAGFRTLLAAAGTKSVDISVNGIVTDNAGFETFQGYANAGSINAMSMGWADGDTLEGSFQITSFALTGEVSGAQTYSASLASSGSWTFTAA